MSMEELERILLTHAERYPKMEPTDAVKLIYQNEFGGGHLIRDAQACLQYLRDEYAQVEKNPAALCSEEIGNGLIRVHLAALPPQALAQLGSAFLHSAAAHRGALPGFLQKLALLCRLTAQGCFSFDACALQAYLERYSSAGYPAVSHSAAYRAAYRPAYRVVLRQWQTLFPSGFLQHSVVG